MIKILFVDDEEKITDGLRRMLRPMRNEWKMSFASSGTQALEILSTDSFDVVVSDMRMPGMDGAQLLTEVMQRYPQTIRLILSGYSEREMLMRSVGAAHQYLSKPCDAEILKNTVERACALRALLGNEKIRLLVTQMHSLPSLPSLYADLVRELKAPEASIKRVSEIIAQDPAMTVKMLQVVNSSFFGTGRHIANAEEAVRLLGLETVMSLALSLHAFSQFETGKTANFSLEDFWEQSLCVSRFAQQIAKELAIDSPESAFTAGLLHDIGKVVLVANLPEQYNEALGLVNQRKISLNEAEQLVFGATHAEIGGYLLGIWGLPNSIIEAIVFHHEPSRCAGNEPSLLTAVHIANFLHNELNPLNTNDKEYLPDAEYLKRLNLVERIPEFREAYKNISKTEDALVGVL